MHRDPPGPDAAAAYCRARCAPEGSNLYYALLFETEQRRRLLCALHTYAVEVGEIPQRRKDPGVARLKLQWWRMELERARRGEAEHPATRELHSVLAPEAKAWEQLPELAAACEEELQPRAPLSPSAARCAHWLLTASADGVPLPTARELAHLLTCYEMLLVLPGAGARLESARLEELAGGLREQRPRVPAGARAELLPCLIMARLAELACTRRAVSEPPRSSRRTDPGPLRKLWLAWRIQRWSQRTN